MRTADLTLAKKLMNITLTTFKDPFLQAQQKLVFPSAINSINL
jgi:hypothetical protein